MVDNEFYEDADKCISYSYIKTSKNGSKHGLGLGGRKMATPTSIGPITSKI